ncbi:EAL domain-containing protein [Pontixanthobacter aestiaquae]|uniref:EAL domain-containing protein n=1 Tax=Pontixanthobacter aestiaquae TaxID=1509367 RepID=A0A844Z6S4_9SPHN|nr:EAL domain-containing protein [Pontixanthobacter aestiaquae]MDN3646492.1 EAL domain-containing protein [Pontixanthobacter aestiaquae]MXO82520.1 EAL domain-containing protein [Pontixanthobacter aestiaquae]
MTPDDNSVSNALLPNPNPDTGPDDRVDRILDAVREHLGVEIAFVSRYIDEDRELMNVRSDLDLPMGPGYREPKENGYCWHVLQGNLPELIQDPADFPFTEEFAITKMLPVGCHLNVPLRLADGSVYGSFCALSRKPDRSMTERDLGVVRAFAQLAAEQIETTLEEDTRRSTLHKTISQLISGDRLTIVHQPIHSLDSNEPVGVECLARFPDAGSRGPDQWFDEAEEVGLGTELEMLAVRSALATLPYVPEGHYMSVNASPATIISGALEQALGDSDGDRLVIEVTEHQQVEDFQALADALRWIGPKAKIAIDDVGAGYAGLRHIVDLEPDILKLDMSLTRDIHRNPARRALAAAMVAFSNEIGCKLIAEGIENEQERNTLQELGVTMGQGYFFSKPLPVIASQQWLMQNRGIMVDEDTVFAAKPIDPSQGEDIAELRLRA